MFYDLDSTRVTLREYRFGTPALLMPLVALLKLLRVRLPGSSDDPNVDSLAPYRVGPEQIPENVRAKFAPVEEQLWQCGFVDPVYSAIHDPHSLTKIFLATYRHASGNALAKVHYRLWSGTRPSREYLFPVFVSGFADGTFLVSTAGKTDMLAPDCATINRIVGASAAGLWKSHGEQLSLASFGKTVLAVDSRQEMLELEEKHHAAVRDFHIERGVFKPRDMAAGKVVATPVAQATGSPSQHPLTPNPSPAKGEGSGYAVPAWGEGRVEAVAAPGEAGAVDAVPVAAAVVSAGPAGQDDPVCVATLAEIERLQTQKAGWANAVLVLVITAGLFFGLGSPSFDWRWLLLVAGILFFHELGHLAAMWLFRYRNLRMFFIPFFGAAVTGQNYNVPGWKKVIVSLMGPLPGIVLGIALGVAGLATGQRGMVNAGLLVLGINAFNLLPVLPLDGGWVMHAVLFCRHPVLDVAFRAVAAGLLLLSGLAGMKLLAFVGVMMLLALPASYRLAEAVRRLRSRGLDAVSADAQTVPPETARAIVQELRSTLPANTDVKNLARFALQAFEALNARPPGWLASLAFLFVHAGAFVLALVSAAVFIVMRETNVRELVAAAARQPKHAIDCRAVLAWDGPDAAGAAGAPANTIIADFPGRAEAEVAYQDLTGRLPRRASARLFGQTLLVALPADDDAAREQWFKDLQGRSAKVFVDSSQLRRQMTLSCTAPSAEAAEALATEARLYWQGAQTMHLIPPWSPDQKITEEHRKARRTYAAIQERLGKKFADQRLRSILKKIGEARLRGDAKAAKSLTEEHRRILRGLDKEYLDQLRQEGAEKWDLALVDQYQKSPPTDTEWLLDARVVADRELVGRAKDHRKEMEQRHVEMGKGLGQLPLGDGRPAPGTDRYSASMGGVQRAGLLLRFSWVQFVRPTDGAPAMARWLAEKGCIDLKYEFQSGAAEDDEDAADAPTEED